MGVMWGQRGPCLSIRYNKSGYDHRINISTSSSLVFRQGLGYATNIKKQGKVT